MIAPHVWKTSGRALLLRQHNWTMAKQARKSKKRWPRKERLMITDPPVALASSRRATKTAAATMATLGKDFKKAHEDGMAALDNQDFDALGDAIKRERNVIDIQSELIEKSTGKKSTRRK
jgi:hypothetical protein